MSKLPLLSATQAIFRSDLGPTLSLLLKQSCSVVSLFYRMTAGSTGTWEPWRCHFHINAQALWMIRNLNYCWGQGSAVL